MKLYQLLVALLLSAALLTGCGPSEKEKQREASEQAAVETSRQQSQRVKQSADQLQMEINSLKSSIAALQDRLIGIEVAARQLSSEVGRMDELTSTAAANLEAERNAKKGGSSWFWIIIIIILLVLFLIWGVNKLRAKPMDEDEDDFYDDDDDFAFDDDEDRADNDFNGGDDPKS